MVGIKPRPVHGQVRNLATRHTIVLSEGKVTRMRPGRAETIRERRRINPNFGYRLQTREPITDTAANLYVNLGPEKRGLGTRKHHRRKRGH